MKPFTAIFLALIFSLGQLGISFSVHHCMGKTSVSFMQIDFNKNCSCDGVITSPNDGCCSNEQYSFKADTDTPTPQYSVKPANYLTGFVAVLLYQTTPITPTNSAKKYSVINSSFDVGPPLNILHGVFRI